MQIICVNEHLCPGNQERFKSSLAKTRAWQQQKPAFRLERMPAATVLAHVEFATPCVRCRSIIRFKDNLKSDSRLRSYGVVFGAALLRLFTMVQLVFSKKHTFSVLDARKPAISQKNVIGEETYPHPCLSTCLKYHSERVRERERESCRERCSKSGYVGKK